MSQEKIRRDLCQQTLRLYHQHRNELAKLVQVGLWGAYYKAICEMHDRAEHAVAVPPAAYPKRRVALMMWRLLSGDLNNASFRNYSVNRPECARDWEAFGPVKEVYLKRQAPFTDLPVDAREMAEYEATWYYADGKATQVDGAHRYTATCLVKPETTFGVDGAVEFRRKFFNDENGFSFSSDGGVVSDTFADQINNRINASRGEPVFLIDMSRPSCRGRIESISVQIEPNPAYKPNQGVFMKALQQQTLIYGTDIKTMTPDDLLKSIERAEKEINRYKTIASQSKYLDKRVAELQEAVKVMVAELDSRADE